MMVQNLDSNKHVHIPAKGKKDMMSKRENSIFDVSIIQLKI